MSDAFGISTITAAGGNSRMARSVRAKLQWRDRFGRWIEMGRGVKFKIRDGNGRTRSVIGSFVGAKDAQTGQVYVHRDPNGLPDGFYDVKSGNAQMNVATLTPEQLKTEGIELGKDINGNAVGERASEMVPSITEIPRADAPEGWRAEAGTYGGKKVISTEDGDFRVHFAGKDDTVLLEDHRGRPGVAEPQRSVAEAFLKVEQTDIQREAGGDTAYQDLATGNDAKVAQLGREELINSIKLNESTINNERASIDAKQRAMQQNEQIKADLAAKGFDPYDPEGIDNPNNAAETPAATPETPAPATNTTTGDIDTSSFDVAAEGFLVPTGRSTNDLTPQGLATFVGNNKESLAKGGTRLVVDSDTGTAEVYNSAETVEDAKAQAGGLGQDSVLDLKAGKVVQVSEGAVDPNSADVNPNLDGDTSPEAPNAQDRDPNAVEPVGTDSGSAPATGEPVEQQAPAGQPAAAPAQRDANEGGGNAADPRPDAGADAPTRATDPTPAAERTGSGVSLEDRRSALQKDFEVAGPDTRVAISEELRRLDQDINREALGDAPSKDVESRTPQVGDLTNEELLDEIRRMDEAADVAENNNSSTDEIMARLDELRADLDRRSREVDNPDDWTPADKLDDESLRSELEARAGQDWGRGAMPTDSEQRITDLANEVAARMDPDNADIVRQGQSRERIPVPAEGLESMTDANLQNFIENNELVRRAKVVAQDFTAAKQIEDENKAARLIMSDRAEARGEAPTAPDKFEGLSDNDGYNTDVRGRVWKWNSGTRSYDFVRDDSVSPDQPELGTVTDTKFLLDDAWSKTDPFPESWIEKRERSALRILRDAEAKGDLQKGIDRLSEDEKNSLTDEVAIPLGIREAAPVEETTPEVTKGEETPEVAPDPEPTPSVPSSPLSAYEQAEAERIRVLADPDSTDEQIDAAEAAADDAWRANEASRVETPEPDISEQIAEEVDRALEERDQTPAPAPVEESAPAPDDIPEAPAEVDLVSALTAEQAANDELIDNAEETGGLFKPGDDPMNVAFGHDNRLRVAKAKAQGKEFTPEQRAALDDLLRSNLSDNQLRQLEEMIDARPNRANTVTIARPADEQPDYLSTADVEVIDAERSDPSFVFDEDLTWRRVLEEFPNAQQLDNGDLILETTNNKGKRYDAILRRTDKNRYLTYVQETDAQGNRRAKRIGNTEWHSYEALEKRITEARRLINSKSPAGSLARRKDQPTENLGTQGFLQDDFLGDIGNPNAPLPSTGDDKFDVLLQAAAERLRAGDSTIGQIEEILREIDPGANAVNTIMQGIIGRAQDTYKPDAARNWQMYDGERAEIGMHFDWTDWHEEKNWWLPNGQLNRDRTPNPNYGLVGRGRVVGYVEENTDGKGHTYGDHVWVQMMQPDGTWGKWVKRSAQTLRRTDEGSELGNPFFSKKEEWRNDPEELARRFRVPNAAPDEPVQTTKRPARDLPASRRLRYTARGTLTGYSNVPAPVDQPEIAGMITRQEITPNIRPASEARPGMMIERRSDEGQNFVDSIIRVENLGNGSYRIHAARPDGQGYANVDSFVVNSDMDLVLWNAPAIQPPASRESKNERQGQVVEFSVGDELGNGVVAFDNGDGTVIVARDNGDTIDLPVSAIREVPDAEVSSEDRVDALALLSEKVMPKYLERLIQAGLLSPGLPKERYVQLIALLENFSSGNSQSRMEAELLDILGATEAQRADYNNEDSNR